MACFRITLTEQGRRHIKTKLIVAFEPGFNFAHEFPVAVQPGNFILVFVGH